jgi:hypothetical protein
MHGTEATRIQGPVVTRTLTKQQQRKNNTDYPRCIDCLHFFKRIWRPVVATLLYLAGLATVAIGGVAAASGGLAFVAGLFVTIPIGGFMIAGGSALMAMAGAIMCGNDDDKQDKFTGRSYTFEEYQGRRFEVYDEDFTAVIWGPKNQFRGYRLNKNPIGVYPQLPDRVEVVWEDNGTPRYGISPKVIRPPEIAHLNISPETHNLCPLQGWVPKPTLVEPLQAAEPAQTVEELPPAKAAELAPISGVARMIKFFTELANR